MIGEAIGRLGMVGDRLIVGCMRPRRGGHFRFGRRAL